MAGELPNLNSVALTPAAGDYISAFLEGVGPRDVVAAAVVVFVVIGSVLLASLLESVAGK
jgi:hypothetical protein